MLVTNWRLSKFSMQVKSDDGQLLSLIREAKSLALITDSQADADTVSAMLAFYHLFKSETLKIGNFCQFLLCSTNNETRKSRGVYREITRSWV